MGANLNLESYLLFTWWSRHGWKKNAILSWALLRTETHKEWLSCIGFEVRNVTVKSIQPLRHPSVLETLIKLSSHTPNPMSYQRYYGMVLHAPVSLYLVNIIVINSAKYKWNKRDKTDNHTPFKRCRQLIIEVYYWS